MAVSVKQNSHAANGATKNSRSEFTTACSMPISNNGIVAVNYSRNGINQAIDLSPKKDFSVSDFLKTTDNSKAIQLDP